MAWDEYIADGIASVQRGDYSGAETSFKQALQFAKHNYPRTDGRLAFTLSLLGHTYFFTHEFQRAEMLLEQSLRLHLEAPDQANGACGLMDAFALQEIKVAGGKRVDACRLLQKAIEMLRKNDAYDEQAFDLGIDELQTVLGRELSLLTNDEFLQLRKDQEETNGNGDAGAAAQSGETGGAPVEATAVDQQSDAPDAGTTSGGSGRSSTWAQPDLSAISGSHSAAELWNQQLEKGLAALQNDEDERESWVSGYLHLESALKLARKMFDQHDPKLISTIKALGDAAAKLRMFDLAEALYREAIAAARRAPEPDFVSVVALRLNLAIFYAEFDQLSKAKTIMEGDTIPDNLEESPYGAGLAARLDKTVKLIGVNNRVQDLVRQAQDAEEQNEVEKANKLMNTAFSSLRQAFAPNHPEMARVLRYRAKLLKQIGQADQSDELAQRAERIERGNEAAQGQWDRITEELPRPDLGVPV